MAFPRSNLIKEEAPFFSFLLLFMAPFRALKAGITSRAGKRRKQKKKQPGYRSNNSIAEKGEAVSHLSSFPKEL